MGCHFLLQRSTPPGDQTHISCISCTAGGFFTAEPSRIRLIMIKMHLKTRIKSRLSMLLLEVILVFTCVDTGRSVQLSDFFFFLPPSQLWNLCFKITIVRSPECKTDNPICSQTWGSCTHIIVKTTHFIQWRRERANPLQYTLPGYPDRGAWPAGKQSMGSQSPDTPEASTTQPSSPNAGTGLTTLPELTSRLLSKPAVHVPQITHLSVSSLRLVHVVTSVDKSGSNTAGRDRCVVGAGWLTWRERLPSSDSISCLPDQSLTDCFLTCELAMPIDFALPIVSL